MIIPVYMWKIDGEEPQENPVVPFRPKAMSSTGKRTDPAVMLRTSLWAAASQVTNDANKAGKLVEAMLDLIQRRQTRAPKGKLVPFKNNPPATVKIYNRILEIKASKAGMRHNCDSECRRAGHNYVHKFPLKYKNGCIYGLSDGSLLVKR